MAADEVLLEAACAGAASLRFYGWSAATVSLGYFQPERRRQGDARLARLPFVRRPSGGDALVHDRELTYALGLPPGPPWQGAEPWPRRMHRILAAALVGLGVAARLHPPAAGQPFTGELCFQHLTSGDVLVGATKVAGSAQRKRRGALLQHGGILLAASPHAPQLPGIRELSGRDLSTAQVCAAVCTEFTGETGWQLVAADWTADERRWVEEIAAARYGRDAWNRKR
jgi:lipoate-protein ligase A